MALSTQDQPASDTKPIAPPAMTPPTQTSIQPGPAQMAPQVGAAVQPSAMQPGAAPTPTPVSQAPALAPAGVAPSAAPNTAAAPAAGTPPGVGVQGITPGQDLRNSSVLPTGDTVDRYKLANDRFNTFAEQTQPQFEAGLRSATQKAAANGAIGSGMLQTDYGNLANQRDLNLRGERSGLLQNALEGSIGDAANNRNEYRQERGYQNGLENQGYERGVQGLQLEDQLTNSQFGRGLASSQFGASGNPGSTQLGLAGMYGQQASDAGNSLGQMVQQNASNGILSSIYGAGKQAFGGGGSQAPAVSPDNGLLSSIYGN